MRKKLLKFTVLSLFLTVGASFSTNAGCTKCNSGSDECHRVIVGNTVHIFHGVEAECPE